MLRNTTPPQHTEELSLMTRSAQDLPENTLAYIRSRNALLSGLIHPNEYVDFFEQPLRDTKDINNLPFFLDVVNYHSAEYSIHQPHEVWSCLSQLYAQLQNDDTIRNTPEYLRFLWQLLSAAKDSSHLSEWEKVAAELEERILYHYKILFWDNLARLLRFWPDRGDPLSSLYTSITISEAHLRIYRDKILNPLWNLAEFYEHIWRYQDAGICAIATKTLSDKFCSSQLSFEVTITQILVLMNQKHYDKLILSLLLAEARFHLNKLVTIYCQNPSAEKFLRKSKLLLKIIEVRRKAQQITWWNLNEVVWLLEERDILMREDDIGLTEQAILIQVEIILHMTYDRILSTPEALTQALERYPKAVWAIIKNGEKIGNRWFDLDAYLETDSRGLFIAPLVSLFEHRVNKLCGQFRENEKSDSDEWIEILHMMVSIYDIAFVHANGRIEYLQKQWFYEWYILAATRLLNTLYTKHFDSAQTIKYIIDCHATILSDSLDLLLDPNANLNDNIGFSLYWKIWTRKFRLAWRDIQKIHIGPRTTINNLSMAFFASCINDFWLITFPNGSWCSLVESRKDGSMTLRFWIQRDTTDELPPFTGLAHIIYSPDGTIHTDWIFYESSRDQPLFDSQFVMILEKLQLNTRKIKKNWRSLLKNNPSLVECSEDWKNDDTVVFKNKFWTIYAHWTNSQGKNTFIVHTQINGKLSRCEINTWQENWKNIIYIGSMLNSEWAPDINQILWWFANIVFWEMESTESVDSTSIQETEIRFGRDDAHEKRKRNFTVGRFLKPFWSRSKKIIKSKYFWTFWKNFMKETILVKG